jgi:maltose O-acetyltransferase
MSENNQQFFYRERTMTDTIEKRTMPGQDTLTEKEKMLKGLLYNAIDEELQSDRLRAKDLCFRFNALIPSDEEARQAVLKQLLGKTADAPCIMSPFWCDYGYNIEIGEHFFSNHNLVILDCAKVTFGDHVFVAPHCGFHTAGHPVDFERRNQGLEFAYPITVGDNVWIGAGVQVMPGVTIGSNVVIGGGSIVTRNIPDNVVAVGNPCRVLRPVGDEDRLRYCLPGH